MSLIVKLTPEQIAAIAPAYARIVEMDEAGQPGMLVAQVYRTHMVVGLLDEAKAVKVQEALGHTDRSLSRTAFDRPDSGSLVETVQFFGVPSLERAL